MAKKKLPEIRKEVRELESEKLTIEVRDNRSKMVTLRTQAVTEKVEDNSQFRKTRKAIARLLTERRARQIKAAAKG